jgi:branched-chain amino acid transport system permease protein
MATRFLIFAIFAMSLDVIFGYTGLWSLGHAAFFGTGGYVFGILLLHFGVESFWLAAFCGVMLATIAAAFFGLFALRVPGLYFMMVTFALGQLLFSVAVNWYDMTGGPQGLSVLRPELGIPWFSWTDINLYYLVFVAFVISFLILYRIVNSPFGRALQGIRDDESRMKHLGYNTWLFKYIAFVIAGLFAGLAGVLYAPYSRLMTPYQIGFTTSVLAMLYVIIGGVGTLWGAVIGAGVMIFLEFGASMFTAERWPLILGGVFVLVVMFLRGGIAPHLVKFWKNIKVK